MEVVHSELEPLTLIKRPISERADHYGIFLKQINGEYIVFDVTCDDSGQACCRFITLEEFAHEQLVEKVNEQLVEKVKSDKSSPDEVKERIKELVQRSRNGELPYGIGSDSTWNCEQAAWYVLTGKRVSMQLRAEAKTHFLQKLSLGAGLVALGGTVVAIVSSVIADKVYQDNKDGLDEDI